MAKPSYLDISTLSAMMVAGSFMMMVNPLWAVAAGVIAYGYGYALLIAMMATAERTDGKFTETHDECFREQIRITGSCPKAEKDERDAAAIREDNTYQNNAGDDGVEASKVIRDSATRVLARKQGKELNMEENLLALQQRAMGLVSDKTINGLERKYANHQAEMREREAQLHDKSKGLAQQVRDAVRQHEKVWANKERKQFALDNVTKRLSAANSA